MLPERVAAGAGLVALLGLGAACARTRSPAERSPGALLGVSAAFVFAAQLVNFPVAFVLSRSPPSANQV